MCVKDFNALCQNFEIIPFKPNLITIAFLLQYGLFILILNFGGLSTDQRTEIFYEESARKFNSCFMGVCCK